MQRQSDNRQHQIAQALAFLDKYRKLRGDCVEVDYNIGRAFEYISEFLLSRSDQAIRLISLPQGIFGLATKHYQRALSYVVEDEPNRALQRTAAYCLVQLFVTSGNPSLAREIAHSWLAV